MTSSWTCLMSASLYTWTTSSFTPITKNSTGPKSEKSSDDSNTMGYMPAPTSANSTPTPWNISVTFFPLMDSLCPTIRSRQSKNDRSHKKSRTSNHSLDSQTSIDDSFTTTLTSPFRSPNSLGKESNGISLRIVGRPLRP
jgi:hypothetical protein